MEEEFKNTENTEGIQPSKNSQKELNNDRNNIENKQESAKNPLEAAQRVREEQNIENEDMDFKNRIPLEELHETVTKLKEELAKVIVGQQEFIEKAILKR